MSPNLPLRPEEAVPLRRLVPRTEEKLLGLGVRKGGRRKKRERTPSLPPAGLT